MKISVPYSGSNASRIDHLAIIAAFDQVKSPVRRDRVVSRRPRRETSPAYHVAAITRETHSLCYVGALIAASEIESGTDCIQTTIVEITGSRGEINGASLMGSFFAALSLADKLHYWQEMTREAEKKKGQRDREKEREKEKDKREQEQF